jgi:hypothetical protein
MPRWVPPPPLELQLWYGDVLVAELHQVFPHQGTWFAAYELKIASGQGGPFRTVCLSTSRSPRTSTAGLRTGRIATSRNSNASVQLPMRARGECLGLMAARCQ